MSLGLRGADALGLKENALGAGSGGGAAVAAKAALSGGGSGGAGAAPSAAKPPLAAKAFASEAPASTFKPRRALGDISNAATAPTPAAGTKPQATSRAPGASAAAAGSSSITLNGRSWDTTEIESAHLDPHTLRHAWDEPLTPAGVGLTADEDDAIAGRGAATGATARLAAEVVASAGSGTARRRTALGSVGATRANGVAAADVTAASLDPVSLIKKAKTSAACKGDDWAADLGLSVAGTSAGPASSPAGVGGFDYGLALGGSGGSPLHADPLVAATIAASLSGGGDDPFGLQLLGGGGSSDGGFADYELSAAVAASLDFDLGAAVVAPPAPRAAAAAPAKPAAALTASTVKPALQAPSSSGGSKSSGSAGPAAAGSKAAPAPAPSSRAPALGAKPVSAAAAQSSVPSGLPPVAAASSRRLTAHAAAAPLLTSAAATSGGARRLTAAPRAGGLADVGASYDDVGGGSGSGGLLSFEAALGISVAGGASSAFEMDLGVPTVAPAARPRSARGAGGAPLLGAAAAPPPAPAAAAGRTSRSGSVASTRSDASGGGTSSLLGLR